MEMVVHLKISGTFTDRLDSEVLYVAMVDQIEEIKYLLSIYCCSDMVKCG